MARLKLGRGLARRLPKAKLFGPVSVRQPSRMIGNQLATSKESPALTKLVHNACGASQDGRDWAMAALHPCGASAPMSVGLPDTITAPVVTPSYRGEFDLAFDVTMFDTAPAAGTTWSCQVVVPPVPEISLMYRIRDDKSNVWSRWRVNRQPGMANPGGTWDLNTEGTTLRALGYSKARIVGRGTTFELNASALNNQGRVVSGQLGFVSHVKDVAVPAYGPVGTATIPPFEVADVSRVIELKVPAGENFLVANCPRAYQEEARHGAYVIQKFDGPLLGYQFREAGDDTISGNVPQTSTGALAPGTLMPLSFLTLFAADDSFDTDSPQSFTADSNVISHLPANYHTNSGLGDGSGFHPFVSDPSDMQTSVTFFVGMPLATLNPTIRAKTRLFLECISKGSAGIAPFTHPSPKRDMVAIDNVVAVMQEYDDAFPASYNGLGDILGMIASWLPEGTTKNVLNGVLNHPLTKKITGFTRMAEQALLRFGGGVGGGASSSGANAGIQAVFRGGQSGLQYAEDELD